MKIILLGSPGAGKGTQAYKLKEYYNAIHISTGDIFRYNINNNTVLGKKVKEYLSRGELVPDELTIDLIKDKLSSISKDTNIILDGFPRNLNQAIKLDEYLEEKSDKIDYCLNIDVLEEVLIDRLTGRRVAPKSGKVYHIKNNPPKIEGICDVSGEKLIQREDDKEETVKDRIKVYNEKTYPLIEYYRKKGILLTIDGKKSPEYVFSKIVESI